MHYPHETKLLADPIHVEHSVDWDAIRTEYPFDDMDQYDFFWVERKDVQKVRTAIQRYYAIEPVSYFLVRKYDDDRWVCRRVL
jgi:hypothetical protein